jgi:N-acetylglucosamine-6-sulfatase
MPPQNTLPPSPPPPSISPSPAPSISPPPAIRTAAPRAWNFLTLFLALLALAFAAHPTDTHAVAPRNVILILADDHRHDFMGFHSGAPDWLETPAMDRMAAEGAQFTHAFVTTSLCSPVRASILTGQYMHRHGIVDNQRPEPPGTRFFPQWLQPSGVATVMIGKWHMGHEDDRPRPGFDHWVSFPGQGDYFDPILNVNGERRRFTGYDADVLTTEALRWISDDRPKDRPFYLHLAFKGPHYPFEPAARHRGRYTGKPIPYPDTMARTEQNYRTHPRWVRERRYSIHGIDHMETGRFDHDPVPSFEDWYYRYCEAIHSIDDNLGRVLRYLEDHQLAQHTLVLYLSDGGFHMGEHGFYDKRAAFEPSIRIPLLAWAPGLVQPGTLRDQLITNLDLAPTILDLLNITPPADAQLAGQSFLPLLQGHDVPWRDHVLYEYHWEWNFPATPTMLAIRTRDAKYVYYHGIWDSDSFHDLAHDPAERHNLIDVPSYQDQIRSLRHTLFSEFDTLGGLNLPLRIPTGERLDQRKLP